MFCCSNCFSDRFLKEEIELKSYQNGPCSFCKRKSKVISPFLLLDTFEQLVNLYEVNEKGEDITELIHKDWNLFNIKSKKVRKNLLKSILKDEDFFSKKYKVKYIKEIEQNIELWENFRNELIHRNRFFPKVALKKEDLELFVKYIQSFIKKDSNSFYRARINKEDKPIKLTEMGKPPKNIVLNGRANPIGIPYLYVSSNIETAISEVRAHKGESLTIAQFQSIENLDLIDLRNPRDSISPYASIKNEDLENVFKNIPLLTLFGEELSKPISPRKVNLEYLPSQYLCELIKIIGLDGIIYKSSVSDGDNYVIFSDDKLKIISSNQYIITGVFTEFDEI